MISVWSLHLRIQQQHKSTINFVTKQIIESLKVNTLTSSFLVIKIELFIHYCSKFLFPMITTNLLIYLSQFFLFFVNLFHTLQSIFYCKIDNNTFCNVFLLYTCFEYLPIHALSTIWNARDLYDIFLVHCLTSLHVIRSKI